MVSTRITSYNVCYTKLLRIDWPIFIGVTLILCGFAAYATGRALATTLYGADGVTFLPAAATRLQKYESLGYGRLPVCMAKTQNSLSDDATRRGRPRGFRITAGDCLHGEMNRLESAAADLVDGEGGGLHSYNFV